MAKSSTKKTATAPVKTATPVKKSAAPRAKKATSMSIDKACENALVKLQSLGVEQQLQADIAWCIGSYKFDNNPIGLYQVGAKAVEALTAAKAKNAKSVPAKVLSDLKKAIKQ